MIEELIISESKRQTGKAEGNAENDLAGQVQGLRADELDKYLKRHEGELITDPRPFADFMRNKLREKGLLQQNVFLAADISENYGYKLIAEEKRTRQRDVILRLCFAAQFQAEEAQEALVRYGMAPLWRRFPRDAILLAAFNSKVYELQEVNRLLEQHGYPPLIRDYE